MGGLNNKLDTAEERTRRQLGGYYQEYRRVLQN